MKVFISWSGELSKKMAEELRSWLPTILQAVTPWVSSQDIRTGSRWLTELSSELDQTNFGLLCVTPEALQSAWLNFEAGALGKRINDPKTGVVSILFGLAHGSVSGPIGQFQNVAFARDEMLKVLKDINSRLQQPLDHALVAKLFEKFWDDLDTAYKKHCGNLRKDELPQRSERELLEEMLARVKHQEEILQELRSTKDDTRKKRRDKIAELELMTGIVSAKSDMELFEEVATLLGLSKFDVIEMDGAQLSKVMGDLGHLAASADRIGLAFESKLRSLHVHLAEPKIKIETPKERPLGASQ